MRPGRTTTERGYGHQHQQARADALKAYRPGQPCPRCGQGIWVTDPASLHLDHTDDRAGYHGLAHPACNTRAGQAKAMRSRRSRSNSNRTTKRSRNW